MQVADWSVIRIGSLNSSTNAFGATTFVYFSVLPFNSTTSVRFYERIKFFVEIRLYSSTTDYILRRNFFVVSFLISFQVQLPHRTAKVKRSQKMRSTSSFESRI